VNTGSGGGAGDGSPAVELERAALRLGGRTLWSDVNLRLDPGQFLTVLGANGTGKTSLLRVLLGDQALSAGTANVLGTPVKRGSSRVGYVPQRTAIDAAVMIRARDMVRMGLDGHRFGLSFQFGATQRRTRAAVDEALSAVGATSFADAPVGLLSGGEFQRVRIAQALVSHPDLLICDEPLTALDTTSQQQVAALIDRHCRERGIAVVFVTHEVNAVLAFTDLVLYLAEGRHRLGPPRDVITTAALTDLYAGPVEVVESGGRVSILAASEDHQSWQPATAAPVVRGTGGRGST
jgi:zinc/manganese transport system ATP-binding protein